MLLTIPTILIIFFFFFFFNDTATTEIYTLSLHDALDLTAAGIRRLAVDQHHAGAALLGAATEPAAAECELVAQHRQQRLRSIGVHMHGLPVDDEIYSRAHSGLMPLASMNLVQFRISLSSLVRSAAAGAKPGVMSSLAMRSRTRASAVTAATACSSLALTASGMPLGPKMPYQNPSSTSAVFTPASLRLGTLGRAGERAALVTAIALILPPSTRLFATCTDVDAIGT